MPLQVTRNTTRSRKERNNVLQELHKICCLSNYKIWSLCGCQIVPYPLHSNTLRRRHSNCNKDIAMQEKKIEFGCKGLIEVDLQEFPERSLQVKYGGVSHKFKLKR